MKWFVCTLLAAGMLKAQTAQGLLLPQARHIRGVVLDTGGKPVAEARIDHSNDRPLTHQTGSDGRFELTTRAPVVVIRKAGFQSELVRTKDATEVQITLQKVSEGRTLPTCPNTGRYYGIDGWGATFHFPEVPGIKASRQGHDIDYGARSYDVKTKQGPKGIRHGSGPLWSFGMPLDRDVWRSVKYEEVAFDVTGLTIIDARGQFSNGNRWRNLGKFGESASYSDIDEATARILDHFLDGACLK